MQEYLSYRFEDSAAFVHTFDELPLWSAPFGMLLLQHVELQHGMTVIDIGCGTGFPLMELASRLDGGSKLYGIDPWANAVARAKEKVKNYGLGNVVIIEASAAAMPLADATADLIVSNLGINNFKERDAVFLECKRVLKPGGKLVLTTNTEGHWKEFYNIFYGTLTRLGINGDSLRNDEAHRGTADSIATLFTSAGLQVCRRYDDSFTMRFVNGTAFLSHHFVKLGWLGSWMSLFPRQDLPAIFAALEHDLNEYAADKGELLLTVPVLYMEGQKQ